MPVSPLANSMLATADAVAQTHHVLSPRIVSALQKALPGINADKLIDTLDKLLGGRGNYTLIGSASMHLHALEHPNPTRQLPQPNDIDVVAGERGMHLLNSRTDEQLSELNLKRSKGFAHVLLMKQNDQPELKIDVVTFKTPGFMKYQFRPHQIDGVHVGLLKDSITDYQNRLKDDYFVEMCGGQKQAFNKTQPWLDYFDQFCAEQADAIPLVRGKKTAGDAIDADRRERQGTLVPRKLTF